MVRLQARLSMGVKSHVSLDHRERFKKGMARGGPGHVCCIFSTPKSSSAGRGTTLRGGRDTHYWLVRQLGAETFGVRGMDGDYLPFTDETMISAKELIHGYTPEVAVFEERMLPSAKRHEFRLTGSRNGDAFCRSVLTLDESNVRGLFDLALEYILARRSTRGRNLIRALLRLETDFPGKNQFLFNGFGIKLRKIAYPEGAVICYRKALEYTLVDDHLYYNLARVYYEQGQWWDCMKALTRCFELNPGLPVARDLVMLITALADDAGLRTRYRKPPVPDGVARRAGLLSESVYRHNVQEAARSKDTAVLHEAKRAERQEADGKKNLWLPGREAVGL